MEGRGRRTNEGREHCMPSWVIGPCLYGMGKGVSNKAGIVIYFSRLFFSLFGIKPAC